MPLVSLSLKLVVNINTAASVTQVRQSIVNSGLKDKIENKLTDLAAGDFQTGVPSFDFNLKVIQQGGGVVQVYPKMGFTVDTNRSQESLINAIAQYYDDLQTRFRMLVAGSPDTTILNWHHHKNGQSVNEVEP